MDRLQQWIAVGIPVWLQVPIQQAAVFAEVLQQIEAETGLVLVVPQV